MGKPATRTREATWRAGFHDGVVSTLSALYYADPSISVVYGEVADSHNLSALIAAAKRSGDYASSGLQKYAKQKRERARSEKERQRRAAILAATRRQP